MARPLDDTFEIKWSLLQIHDQWISHLIHSFILNPTKDDNDNTMLNSEWKCIAMTLDQQNEKKNVPNRRALSVRDHQWDEMRFLLS